MANPVSYGTALKFYVFLFHTKCSGKKLVRNVFGCTEQLLENVVSEALDCLGVLQRLVDSLALLDMMVGLGNVVANGPIGPCCRPQLQLAGPLVIVQVICMISVKYRTLYLRSALSLPS